jgi:hypothetical protein
LLNGRVMMPHSPSLGLSRGEPVSPRRSIRRALVALALTASVAVPGVASAEEPWIEGPTAEATGQEDPAAATPPAAPAPAPRPVLVLPAGAPPSNVTTFPDGSVSVSRTPAGGVDVHAQTAAGTVHAYGCSRVDVDARTATGAPPPPCAVAPYPYPYPYPAYYPYPVPTPYYVAAPVVVEPPKPKPPRDPARTGALIASSLVFGLGTATAGGVYLASVVKPERTTCDAWGTGGCSTTTTEPNKAALYAMGGIMTVTPSIPRYVVGDVGLGLLFTALRGGSFAAGAFVDWKDKTYAVPTMFAFVVPLTLGIVDLATTPRRERAQERATAPRKPKAVELAGIGPTATPDQAGNLAPSLAAVGRF